MRQTVGHLSLLPSPVGALTGKGRVSSKGVRVEVKGETGDKFPKKVGRKHNEPSVRNVLHFYNKMLGCTRSDLDK